ncbi:hypothetical protein [Exiguobacterium sp.]|uniref:hypothetical protein n=1 Tax=Exiguobacterium sp. TaxID=44751 RepID=UPI00263ABDC5|nr:hypothetical protein [Exiguobacterium sp.]MCC5893460.1 hypothetical protein [Exiguobacterium sp.]
MKNKKLTHFTLIDLVERKIQFTKTNPIFDQNEFKHNNEGERLAYREMLSDMKEMKEDEFLDKYLHLLKTLAKKFESNAFTDKREQEKMTGYNIGIVFVLKCIDPIYEFDLEEYPLPDVE